MFLTLFRIVAAILITVYLVKLVKRTDFLLITNKNIPPNSR